MPKPEERSYSEVWKAKIKEKKKYQRGFEEDIDNLKELYNYQRYHKSEIGYDEKIIEAVDGNHNTCKELKSDFMNKINWIALWKTNRIIEFDNADDIEKNLESLKNLKESDSLEASKAVFRSLLNESRGVKLAMSSTIMHFYNPNVFPIIDKRAYRAISIIKQHYGKFDMSNITETLNTIELEPIEASTGERERKYYEYIEDCRELIQKLKEANQNNISMKNIDKFLYQIDNLTAVSIKDVQIKG